MGKVKKYLKTFIFASIGVYIGNWLWLWYHFSTYPEVYSIQSAPWYYHMIPNTLITIGIIVVTSIIYFVLGKKQRNK